MSYIYFWDGEHRLAIPKVSQFEYYGSLIFHNATGLQFFEEE